jgi:chromosome segregation ATPase
LKESLRSEKNSNASLTRQVSDLQTNIQRLRDDHSTTTSQLDQKHGDYTRITSEYDDQKYELAQMNDRFRKLQSEFDDKRQRLESALRELETRRDDIQQLQDVQDNSEHQIDHLNSLLNAKNEEIRGLKSSVQVLQAEKEKAKLSVEFEQRNHLEELIVLNEEKNRLDEQTELIHQALQVSCNVSYRNLS